MQIQNNHKGIKTQKTCQIYLRSAQYKLVLRKTGRLVPYRLSRFRDFIFQLFGIIGVVVVVVVRI